jgi:hypothetical protein
VENLKSMCTAPDTSLREWCRVQADLVLEIPECDEECQGLAKQLGMRLRSWR